MTEIRKLEPPLNCAACGRSAHYVVDGTSLCRVHAAPHLSAGQTVPNPTQRKD